MKSLLLALAASTVFGLFDPDPALAQNPRNVNGNNGTNYNPLMPNLGVPYTNMNLARSMIYRNNRGRSRYRGRSSVNRPVIINNYYGGGPSAPF
jgi:hypothetical protein